MLRRSSATWTTRWSASTRASRRWRWPGGVVTPSLLPSSRGITTASTSRRRRRPPTSWRRGRAVDCGIRGACWWSMSWSLRWVEMCTRVAVATRRRRHRLTSSFIYTFSVISRSDATFSSSLPNHGHSLPPSFRPLPFPLFPSSLPFPFIPSLRSSPVPFLSVSFPSRGPFPFSSRRSEGRFSSPTSPSGARPLHHFRRHHEMLGICLSVISNISLTY